MKTWKSIAEFYNGTRGNLFAGLGLAVMATLCAVLLAVISGWFITTTALAGIGILSLQAYNLFLPSAAIRFLALGRPVSKYYERLYNHKITFKLIRTSRSRVFANLLRMDKKRLIEFRGTDLAGRLTTDIDHMDQFYVGFLLPWTIAVIIFMLSFIYFLFVFPAIAVLLLTIFLICGLGIPLLALRNGIENNKNEKILHELQAAIADYASGHRELKSFGILKRNGAIIREKFKKLSEETRLHIQRGGFFSMLQGLFLQLSIGAAIFIIYLNHLGQTFGPQAVLVVFAVIALSEILQPLPGLFFNQATTINVANRISELTMKPATVKSNASSKTYLLTYDIRVENLCFTYGKRIIYQNLNVLFEEKKTYLIWGANGSGKSTLFDLICGLQAAQSGAISIGGVDNRDFTDGLRSGFIAYMEQQMTLFDCSIYSNIAIGKTCAGPGEIIAAAYRAGIGKMTEMLPDGIFSVVEENHRNISGGQARMICLARVILKDAPIILLDEPTEGFDQAATKNFVELVNSWKGNKTVIIITHKKIPLLEADRHYLIDAGILIPIDHQQ